MRPFIISLLIVSVIAHQPSHGRVNKRQAPQEPKKRQEPLPDGMKLQASEEPQAVASLERQERIPVPEDWQWPADCCVPRWTPCWPNNVPRPRGYYCEYGEHQYELWTGSCFLGYATYACCRGKSCPCQRSGAPCYTGPVEEKP